MQQQSRQLAKKIQRLIQLHINTNSKNLSRDPQTYFESLLLNTNTLNPSAIEFTNIVSNSPQYQLYRAQTNKLTTKVHTPLEQLLQILCWASNSHFCNNRVSKHKCTLGDLMRSFVKQIVSTNEGTSYKNVMELLYTHFINLATEKYPELLKPDNSHLKLTQTEIIRIPNWDQYKKERRLHRR